MEIVLFLMHLSFASPWVDPRDTARNCVSWRTTTIQSPWVKGIKLMTNSPSLGGEYEHPQHTILYKLSRRTKQIIVTPKYHIYLSLVKITNKCIQFFGTLFAHFHSSIMALGKELFTLPVALENQNERKLCSRAIFRWPNLEQIPWLFPRGPAKSFPKLNNSHPLREKKEIPKLYHCPWVPRGCLRGRATEKQMISA